MFGRRTSSSTANGSTLTVDQEKLSVDPTDELGGGQVQLWQPEAAETAARKSVEGLLLERKQITEEQLTQARNVAAQTPGKTLGQILLTMNAASEAQILAAVA